LRVALGDVATRDYLRSELRDLADDIAQRLRPETPSADDSPADRRSLDNDEGPSITT
jgi:hypothetical protein